MKEHPILFNGEMVRPILDDRKTQTRRVMKPQPSDNGHGNMFWMKNKKRVYGLPSDNPMFDNALLGIWDGCPYGKPGDALYVKETHRITPYGGLWSAFPNAEVKIDYAAGYHLNAPAPEYRMLCAEDTAIWKARFRTFNRNHWRPSIFMPRWASRITLEVMDVRVERVQDIKPIDASREGCPKYIRYGQTFDEILENLSPIEHFAKLWDSINAKRGYSWESNPWVWVVEFKMIRQEEEG